MVSAQQSVSVEANLTNVLELLISARVEFFGASNGFHSVVDLGARWSQAPSLLSFLLLPRRHKSRFIGSP